jgi:hypothetical protein
VTAVEQQHRTKKIRTVGKWRSWVRLWHGFPDLLRSANLQLSLVSTYLHYIYCHSAKQQHFCGGTNIVIALLTLLKPTGSVMHKEVWYSRNVLSAHTAFVCFEFISEQAKTSASYNVNWLVFITEIKCVYCAVVKAVFSETQRLIQWLCFTNHHIKTSYLSRLSSFEV